LERDTGGKEGDYMRKGKIEYTDGPIGNVKIIKDFLPPPEELVYKDENVKVTINLKRSSVDFFKSVARGHRSRYQRVIRSLLDSYASAYSRRR
jgi:hypothetical protein